MIARTISTTSAHILQIRQEKLIRDHAVRQDRLLFIPKPLSCWICGSSSGLTHEHKFKASELRRYFPDGAVDLVKGEGFDQRQLVQGPRSPRLKFRSTICEKCNTSVTQPADRSFDLLLASLRQANALDNGSIDCVVDEIMNSGSEIARSAFRFFAKILGCQLADFGAPVPGQLADFVSGRSDTNCISLWARSDVAYEDMVAKKLAWDRCYMAHGGIVMITRAPSLLPSRAYSTLTVGHVQFSFDYVYSPFEVLEMLLYHPEFVALCAERARQTMDEPIPTNTLRRLGLAPDALR